jgi:Tetracyclin repressor-like, C-terminal domain
VDVSPSRDVGGERGYSAGIGARTIVDRTTAGVLADFHAAVDNLTDPVKRLRRASLVYALRHATHGREAIVVNRDTASLDVPHRTELQNRRREHEHALRQIISDGAAAGVFRVDSPALTSFAIREMAPVVEAGPQCVVSWITTASVDASSYLADT